MRVPDVFACPGKEQDVSAASSSLCTGMLWCQRAGTLPGGHPCSTQAAALGMQIHGPWRWVFCESNSLPEPEQVPAERTAEGMEGAGGWSCSIWASWLPGSPGSSGGEQLWLG